MYLIKLLSLFALITAAAAAQTKVIASDNRVQIDSRCSPDGMIWQLWQKCRDSSCFDADVWCGDYRLTVDSVYNGWDYRNSFIGTLQHTYMNNDVKQSKTTTEKKCTFDCGVKTCYDKETTVTTIPRIMRIEHWTQPHIISGWMQVQFFAPKRENSICSTILDIIFGALSAIDSGVTGMLQPFVKGSCVSNLQAEEWELEANRLDEAYMANYTRVVELHELEEMNRAKIQPKCV
ncbi:hypothetical protein BC832DRAFT_568630 [Gaertneriomyces semiglobifer]|nr:hypothetical protein BC832DRAFT_568630 [Gaertneriomyces semiglobifer]